jgi:DNA mismatch endonuclease (patch repair protein)
MDRLKSDRRSENMRAIRSRNTAPEVAVRSVLHKMGYRFRLHRKGLPGRPDVVFPVRRKVVFVHGCFWHQHEGCAEGRIPSSRPEYWEPKLRGNRERDRRHLEALNVLGWDPLVIWECEIKNTEILAERLQRFLGPPGSPMLRSMALH